MKQATKFWAAFCCAAILLTVEPVHSQNDDALPGEESDTVHDQIFVKLMRNSSSFFVEDLDEDVNLSRLGAWSVGLGFNFAISRLFSIQTEFLYTSKGTVADVPQLTYPYQRLDAFLDYLEVPLLAKFTVSPNSIVSGFFYLGPYAALKLDHSLLVTAANGQVFDDIDFEEYTDEELRAFDAGAILGAGLSVATGPVDIFFDVRFTVGAIPIWVDDNDFTGNQTLSFALGIGI